MIHKAVLALIVLSIALLAVPAASAQTTTSSSQCAMFYTVERGDNLYRIARQFNTSMANLQTWNGITNPSRINAGQVLCVGRTTIIDNPVGQTYTVQRGDTLFAIGRRFGINMWTLAQMNNITNLNRIYVGQALIVPDVTIQTGG